MVARPVADGGGRENGFDGRFLEFGAAVRQQVIDSARRVSSHPSSFILAHAGDSPWAANSNVGPGPWPACACKRVISEASPREGVYPDSVDARCMAGRRSEDLRIIVQAARCVCRAGQGSERVRVPGPETLHHGVGPWSGCPETQPGRWVPKSLGTWVWNDAEDSAWPLQEPSSMR